jgi:hypothetical protein
MNQPTLDSLLSGWLKAEAPRVPPPGFVEQVLATTGRMHPLPAWRALTTVPVMRTQSAVLVGSPGLRLARLAVGLLLLLAALTGTAVVGAQLVQDMALHRAQVIVFASTKQAFGDSPPEWRAPATPNWWECGDDLDCLGAAGLSGPAPRWLYAMSPDGRAAPRVIGEFMLPPRLMLAELSHDGRYSLIGPLDAEDVYRVFRLEGGTSVLDLNPSMCWNHSWSPTSAVFAYTIQNDTWCGGDPSASGLFIYDADANVSRKVLDATPDPTSPVGTVSLLGWSPDGHSVFVTRDHKCPSENTACEYSVDVIEVSTDATPPETREIASAIRPFGLLAPDATRLLYQSEGVLEVSNLDGSDPRRLAEGACLQSLNWSPDGSQVLYVDCAAFSGAVDGGPVGASVVVVPAAGGDARIVGTALYDPFGRSVATPPNFTPDSRSVYWSDADGTWVVGVDGTNLRRLPVPAGVAIDWQFDGP